MTMTSHTNHGGVLRNDGTATSRMKVLCIDDLPYGQTFNIILTIAAARTLAAAMTIRSHSNNHTTTTTTTRRSNNTSASSSTETVQVVVKVGLGPIFSRFYNTLLEPHDDIISDYYIGSSTTAAATASDEEQLQQQAAAICQYTYTSEQLFNWFFALDWNVETRVRSISNLIPNRHIRQQAMTYLIQYRNGTTIRQRIMTFINQYIFTTSKKEASSSPQVPVATKTLITVHRRSFEGICYKLIRNRHNVACLDRMDGGNRKTSMDFFSDVDLSNICNYTYPSILNDIRIHDTDTDSSSIGNQLLDNTIVLLCTDRQVRNFDWTFPHWVSIYPTTRNKNERRMKKAMLMMIEAWIMTLSDIHYGVPMSTVDVVVNFWRNGNSFVALQRHEEQERLRTDQSKTVLTTSTRKREMRPLSCYG